MNAKKKSPRARTALAAAAVGSMVAALTGVVAAGPASADPVTLNGLTYTCKYPLIGEQKVTVDIKSDIPKSVPVGQKIPKIMIDAISTVDENTWSGLSMVGAASLEGSASASSTLQVPQGNLNVKVPIKLDKTPVPVDPAPIVIHGTGEAPQLTFNKAGHGKIIVGDLTLNIVPRDSDGNVVEIPPEPGTSMDKIPCTQDPNQNNVLAEFDIGEGNPDPGGKDTVAPSAPADVKATSDAAGAAKVTWGASTDTAPDGVTPSGVAGYEVFDQTGKSVGKTDSKTTSLSLTGLAAGDYTFSVKATDGAGNVSAAGTAAAVTVAGEGGGGDDDTVAPSTPQGVTGTATSSSVALSWTASTDNVGVTGYEVYDGSGNKVADVTGTSATVSGLKASTQYTFTVKAKDAAGNLSEASAPFQVTTQAGGGGGDNNHVKYGFTLKGSTFVKSPNGSAPLTGAIDADLDLKTKAYTADLSLNKTTGNFAILGFLPVSAGIEIVPTGKVTGTLNGPLKADVNVITKLSVFNLFGAIPIGGGDKCQTKDPSAIHLESDGTFNPLKGGKITGTYKLSEIQDCNILTPILSIFTAGDGNTLDLDLTPVAKS
ncbi:fibronectin type III domain-containing protein [Actinomadura atramentaria]|uniref:fibronectin type III domain-containing protein n=1 Tax=Actinomadura atramentaria TaxID=1990 RepID=UPI0003706993|nr:fibronectin type III domain-containing protein [Actinomadura atramentaria]